jgi:hypothetical protein
MEFVAVLAFGAAVWLVLLVLVVVLCTAASRADAAKDRMNTALM